MLRVGVVAVAVVIVGGGATVSLGKSSSLVALVLDDRTADALLGDILDRTHVTSTRNIGL